jgi:hypothetical protein
MCRKYAIAIMLIICVVLFGCQKQNDISEATAFDLTNPELGQIQDNNAPMYMPIYFADYQEYISFFQDTEKFMSTTESGLIVSDEMEAYIDTFRDEQGILAIPCYEGKPVQLRDDEGYAAIAVLEKELYGFLWTWFYSSSAEENIIIRLSQLSDENRLLASQMSCSQFIATIAPNAPNISNYREKEKYLLVYEDDVDVNGNTTSVLIHQMKDGSEYVFL